jgi:enoyl-CoA hydratase/carnithine racemase
MFDLTTQDGISTITIDRGEKANAIPLDQWKQLEVLVAKANLSKCDLVVIRSSNPDAFSAGSDLVELENLANDAALRRRFRSSMVSVFKRIRDTAKPTVAIVNGKCFGTGVSLALSCDVRVAGPRATFAITPARFGIAYPKEEIDRLAAVVGVGQATRLLYSAEAIDAEEAWRIGLVEILDRTEEPGAHFVRQLMSNVPSSLLSFKAALNGRGGDDKRFEEQLQTPAFRERMNAYCRERKRDEIL